MEMTQLPIQYFLFLFIPPGNLLHTKVEGGLKFFISNFASLSRGIALKCFEVEGMFVFYRYRELAC